MIWNIDKKMSSNTNEIEYFRRVLTEKCNKIPILKFPAIELSKDAIWASQIMQKLAMQNLSRLVMGA